MGVFTHSYTSSHQLRSSEPGSCKNQAQKALLEPILSQFHACNAILHCMVVYMSEECAWERLIMNLEELTLNC